MAGVYGDFLTAFPELFRTIEFRDGRKIRGILVDTTNANIFRQKTGNKSTSVLDMNNYSKLYIPTKTAKTIKESDRFVHPEEGYEMTIVGRVPYNQPAGYSVFLAERVSGADSTQTEQLQVKEAYFA